MNFRRVIITGSIVALVTPMREDGSLDLKSLARLIEHHIEQGTNGIVSVGTTGESATLSHEEHHAVIEKTVQVAADRVPVIAGTGSNSTAEALELTKVAYQLGADACLLVTPYYNKPTQEGLYQHFRLIADSVPIPQILYNVPSRTGVDLENQTVYRLARIDNIIGIKDATADVERGRRLISTSAYDFAVYAGQDTVALDLMISGAWGTISVTANVAPRLMREMCDAVLSGDRRLAAIMNKNLNPVHEAMFVESNPIPVKWGVWRQGLIGNYLRLPLVPLTGGGEYRVRTAMTNAGLL